MFFNEIVQWLEQNQVLMFLIQVGLTIVVLILFILYNQKLKKYRFLLKENENKDLEELLLGISQKINENSAELAVIAKQFDEFQEKSKHYMQHWALVRFKAFNNIGGDQSFALALMDSYGDGLVISSIFGREESVVYCKPIKNGTSVYPLSKEEQDAINQALSQKKVSD